MKRRFIEITLGLIIFFLLITKYSDSTGESELFIWYIITPTVLKVATWVALFFIASSLLFGKNQYYTNPIYNFLGRIFGNPKKSRKSS